MKNYIIAVLALSGGLGLALSLPAAAEKGKGPCAADAAKFCKDVKPGEGRVAACLKEHQAELSQACKDRKALAGEKRGKRGERMGRGGANGCLREYGKGYSSGFKSGVRSGLGQGKARGKGAKGAKVCGADAQKLCKDVKPGEGRVRDCLIKNASKLTDGCKTRVERMKERLEEKGKKV
ncbi:MAG: hypothetical protein CVU79_05195 [Elusimicrobia bacterium HGW-Elusimicrobia-3]|jgi:hypothetical protein|nr:MAG: hypothetical protein CVU79_05195 [Elusimicrobia bacterium HGW-Elusimicrobia-3]